jgi:hypothetical protein
VHIDPSPVKWANFKCLVRDASVRIYRDHRHLRQVATTQAEEAAAAAKDKLCANRLPSQHDTLFAASLAASDAVVKAYRALLDPAELAGEILDHHFGDRSTCYFFQETKPPLDPVVITAINRPGRVPGEELATADLRHPAGRDLGLQYATTFFSSDSPHGLFRTRPVDLAAQAEILSSIPISLSPFLQPLAEGLDGDSLITVEDLKYALSESKRGSSPGVDGLPYEFYRKSAEVLIPLMCRVLNGAFGAHQEGEAGYDSSGLLAPILEGIICLIPKPGQPSDEMSGYRPITLLNCDVKLIMLIMSKRLQRPLDYLVDIVQSAFLRGRDISDNVRYHLGLRARLQELGLPTWLLHSDLTKAFFYYQKKI